MSIVLSLLFFGVDLRMKNKTLSVSVRFVRLKFVFLNYSFGIKKIRSGRDYYLTQKFLMIWNDLWVYELLSLFDDLWGFFWNWQSFSSFFFWGILCSGLWIGKSSIYLLWKLYFGCFMNTNSWFSLILSNIVGLVDIRGFKLININFYHLIFDQFHNVHLKFN